MWKEITYCPGYSVSDDGQVKNDRFGNLLAFQKSNKSDTLTVKIYNKNEKAYRRYSVGRLVADAFIPNTRNSNRVMHIDGDSTNNNVDNLAWSISAGNVKVVRCKDCRYEQQCNYTDTPMGFCYLGRRK